MKTTKLTPKPKPVPSMQDIYKMIQSGKVKEVKNG
jgi:hypothetical protein